MKKLFCNHIFSKIGLLISSYLVAQSPMRVIADEIPDAIASLWPVASSDNLHRLLPKDDVFKSYDSREIRFDPPPAIHNSKQLNTSWEHSTSAITSSQSDENLTPPHLFFSLESINHADPSFQTSSDFISETSQEESATPRLAIEKQRLFHKLQSDETASDDNLKELLTPSPEIKTVSSTQSTESDIEDFSPLKPTTSEHIKISIPQPSIQEPVPALSSKPQIVALDTPVNTNGNILKSQNNATKTILINFNNVSIIEFIRFISRISTKNFVFDEADLQFNVTIVSEEPTTIENIMTALLQELRIHDLTLIEQGNNLIIHKNPKVNSVSRVVAEDLPGSSAGTSEIVTQVFRLNTLEPDRAAAVIRPLVSENAILEFIKDTNHLIVTDLHSNVVEIAKLLKSLDAPNSGLVIGQYVAKSAEIESLLPLVQQIMSPISKDSPLVFVPYVTSNSIFIVSTPFLVERSLSILEHLDQEKGKTQIINLEKLNFEKNKSEGNFVIPEFPASPSEKGTKNGDLTPPEKQLLQTPTEFPILPYETAPFELEPVQNMAPPPGSLRPPPKKVGITEFYEEKPILKEKILRNVPLNENFIPVPVSRSKFYIHKVQYRRGDALLAQIQQIAGSMQNTKGNDELLNVISTADFLKDSKALVFTGAPEYLDKVRALVEEMDIPLRQVFIEMLILDTSIDDSLNYAVNYANDFGGGNQAGAQSFTSGASSLPAAIGSAGVNGLGGTVPNYPSGVIPSTPFNNVLLPDPGIFNNNLTSGFSLGVIGQHIIHKGLGIQFNSIGALVTALHTRGTANIILNPKIVTEDNVPAQIFVGITTPFKTQSISNEQGSILTNNFEFRDVGTSLQVTPHIYNSDMVTLDIVQERSSLATTPADTGNSNTVIGPTTNKNSTKTTVHVPNGFFVIISGMLEGDETRNRTQVPCLGSIPLVGAAFSDKSTIIAKRNLMIFIRPLIVDTDEEFQNLTRHQQDVWRFKNDMPKEWVQETEEALDFFNVRRTFNTDDKDDPECRRYAH